MMDYSDIGKRSSRQGEFQGLQKEGIDVYECKDQ